MAKANANERYFLEYSNLQKVKHDLIRNYLNGWLPKLASWAGKVVYFDTHAGRGRHVTGEMGSPLVAVDALLKHSYIDAILEKCEVSFIFIEIDEENNNELKKEVENLGALPKGVSISTYVDDSFETLKSLIEHFESPERRLAPSFFFIDPFGFKVPSSIISKLMSFRQTEIFLNVIWRELDMAIRQRERMEDTLKFIFGSDSWHEIADENDVNRRMIMTAQHFQNHSGASWATYIQMLDKNRVRYFLLHLTNHVEGRKLMKNCMWKVCPDGGFFASKNVDIRQEILIQPEPDMAPVREWVKANIREPIRFNDLGEKFQDELWLDKHLNRAVSDLRNSGELLATDYAGRFSRKANPLLSLPRK